ncbi:hypothetical protein [Shewanella sp. YIC-542]|uniref:hypothetical protein n=1 Tax=Shewanella mytili TaxID=3377111 RepID=UPI00398F6081
MKTPGVKNLTMVFEQASLMPFFKGRQSHGRGTRYRSASRKKGECPSYKNAGNQAGI